MEYKESGHRTEEHRWIEALCVVKFDHELGLIVEHMMPENTVAAHEATSIAMLSFPESNCAEHEESQTFFFRCRLNNPKSSLRSQPADQRRFLFGYSYYFQRKDEKDSRGYFQKAFVILSKYYFASFYRALAAIMGKAYFKGESKDFLKVHVLPSISIATVPQRGDVGTCGPWREVLLLHH